MREFGENPKRAGTVSGRLFLSAFGVEREFAIGEIREGGSEADGASCSAA